MTDLKSAAVSTATTPFAAFAAEVSIERMRACAYGLRTIDMCAMFTRFTSSTKWPWPVMSLGSSRRWMRAPIMEVTAIVSPPPEPRQPTRSLRSGAAPLIAAEADRTAFLMFS